MKYLICLSLCYLSHYVTAQQANEYLSDTFKAGYPAEVALVLNNYGFTDLKYATLQTGLDSLQIKLGTFSNDEARGYYAVVLYGKKFAFRTINIKHTDTNGIRTDTLSLSFNEYMSVTLIVKHNITDDKIQYKWVDLGAGTRTANIVATGPIQRGIPMPDVGFYTLEDKEVFLSDLKGKYVIINWWHTGCKPCIEEMPVLNQIAEKYKSRPDVTFLALAWDSREKLRSFLSRKGFNYLQGYNRDLINVFGNTFPRHVIIDPVGTVLEILSGLEIDPGGKLDIEKAIEKYMNTTDRE